MHQTMEIYLARKKRVPGHYNPDSNRIFDSDVTDDSLGDSRLNLVHTERKLAPPPPHPREPERRNCPHPWHSRFLRHNVRILNEPVCVMATESSDSKQSEWWPSKVEEDELKVPTYTKDSTHRKDYQRSAPVKGSTRHSSNPFSIPSKGILPVNEPRREYEPGKVLLEKISYRHNYNSRWDRNEPIRGKLHGSFVWDEVKKNDSGNQEVVTPWNRSRLQSCMTVALPTISKQKENQTPPQENIQSPANGKAPQTPQQMVDTNPQQMVDTNADSNVETKTTEHENNPIIPSIDGLPAI